MRRQPRARPRRTSSCSCSKSAVRARTGERPPAPFAGVVAGVIVRPGGAGRAGAGADLRGRRCCGRGIRRGRLGAAATGQRGGGRCRRQCRLVGRLVPPRASAVVSSAAAPGAFPVAVRARPRLCCAARSPPRPWSSLSSCPPSAVELPASDLGLASCSGGGLPPRSGALTGAAARRAWRRRPSRPARASADRRDAVMDLHRAAGGDRRAADDRGDLRRRARARDDGARASGRTRGAGRGCAGAAADADELQERGDRARTPPARARRSCGVRGAAGGGTRGSLRSRACGGERARWSARRARGRRPGRREPHRMRRRAPRWPRRGRCARGRAAT